MLCKSDIVRTLLGSPWGKCCRVGVVFCWDHGGGGKFVAAHIILVGLNPFESIQVLQVGHLNHVGLFKCHSNVVYFTCFDPSAAFWCSRWASSVILLVYIKGPVVMAGLDQALSGLALGQLQAIVAAAQFKLQAVPTSGSTSASAAVDVAVRDGKILFPPVFPMLPDMSNGRFPHSDSALAQAEPGFGWLANITAKYPFKRTLYLWKQKRTGATSTGQTVSPWETTPLSFSDWQGWKVASIGSGTNGKLTFDAHQIQRLFEMWSHHRPGTVA